ncbi:hypothetical protein RMHFA_05212 (plasmid) [Roseomonas mucosa]|uniref:Uncharacterized protein n=1 Tax=Roseomonas mucosa TaxID=207340 RepID=A0A4Y1MR41_9PROT|nr:hypothetical protein RADP37_05212 [Roseomonas mucosa]QDD97743.1 hypothetical protein ADP8_05212 [Roseomonas mucosa]UZO94282.1 hypothetical protein RMP42_05212 [Roseomonas mucosa]UZO98948.1 hypothetical protein RMHFA_05212 [Roseomonas mucosa]
MAAWAPGRFPGQVPGGWPGGAGGLCRFAFMGCGGPPRGSFSYFRVLGL